MIALDKLKTLKSCFFSLSKLAISNRALNIFIRLSASVIASSIYSILFLFFIFIEASSRLAFNLVSGFFKSWAIFPEIFLELSTNSSILCNILFTLVEICLYSLLIFLLFILPCKSLSVIF